MSMAGCPMARVPEIAGMVLAVAFFAKACQAFASSSVDTLAGRRSKRVPDEL